MLTILLRTLTVFLRMTFNLSFSLREATFFICTIRTADGQILLDAEG